MKNAYVSLQKRSENKRFAPGYTPQILQEIITKSKTQANRLVIADLLLTHKIGISTAFKWTKIAKNIDRLMSQGFSFDQAIDRDRQERNAQRRERYKRKNAILK